jgi:hypothetical protein
MRDTSRMDRYEGMKKPRWSHGGTTTWAATIMHNG